ncbi:hypothetical protein [Nannocystis radixulma]|uniref:Uncharacterized protein n=1 Tax=Nannocystis radixulma TaxID=2995305 RepID=A0ABT5B2Q1_9BACT|nr:hypothetical protein [Nannocystis radixulma]MDC0667417.1 hypothetical protein [Nannocystis radixulma]
MPAAIPAAVDRAPARAEPLADGDARQEAPTGGGRQDEHVRKDRRWTPALALGLTLVLAASPGRAAAPPDVRSDMSGETGTRAAEGVQGRAEPGGGPARAGEAEPRRTEPGEEAASGVDEAAQLSAAAQERLDAGDREGAIALWRRAFRALPGGFGYAPRRAAAALAIADAEEGAFRETGDSMRLHAAVAALDAYLGGLDPTDDENRAKVEGRRAELLDMYLRASAPEGPQPAPPAALQRRGFDRRAGLAAAGLGSAAVVAGVVALAGGLTGRAADDDLRRVIGRPCEGTDPLDPCGSDQAREQQKSELVTEGLRANRMALVGGILAGTLLAASLAALVAGAIRGRARVQVRTAGLVVRF